MSAGALAGAYDAAARYDSYAVAANGGAPPPSAQQRAAQTVANSDTPTIAMRTWSGEAAAGVSAEAAAGLARMQRNQFGVKPMPPLAPPAPAAPAAAMAAAIAQGPAQNGAGLTPFQANAGSSGLQTTGNGGGVFGDSMPDSDILRGLALRLEAALKRDGH